MVYAKLSPTSRVDPSGQRSALALAVNQLENELNDKPTEITGRAAVVVSKYSCFDLSNPAATPVHGFSFVNPDYVKDGVLDPGWAKDGYRHVGWAAISVQVLPVKQMMAGAVATLQAEKQHVIATAQAEAMRIEGEIQKLLAISYDQKGD